MRAGIDAEVAILLKYKHPNIIGCSGSFTAGDQMYLLMEYAQGGDLYHRIVEQRKTKFPFRTYKIKNWFAQVLLAVAFLHQNNIYHRDMKTANILIAKTGEQGEQEVLKLCDFGLSKQNEETSKAANTKVGTRQYMSPEVILGQQYKKDADLWSLGCVLYEMWCAISFQKNKSNEL